MKLSPSRSHTMQTSSSASRTSSRRSSIFTRRSPGRRPRLRFGAAFCEASGPRLVRRSGNDDELIAAAVEAALAIACGHCFVVFLRAGYPVNVLNALQQVPEVCRIVCATANPLEVLVAVTASGRGIVGVVDGEPPLGVENDDDVLARLELLRTIGYRV